LLPRLIAGVAIRFKLTYSCVLRPRAAPRAASEPTRSR
jgi:hypothetical protein